MTEKERSNKRKTPRKNVSHREEKGNKDDELDSNSKTKEPCQSGKRDKLVSQNEKSTHPNKLKPVHSVSASLFSSASDFQNYRGVVNLCFLLLLLSNFRVALDNVLKYGVLVDPKILLIFLEDPYSWPSASLVVASHLFIQFAFFVENILEKRKISERVGIGLHAFNLVALLTLAVAVVLTFHPQPWFSTLALSWYTIVWLKLISYAAVNRWCRELRDAKKKKGEGTVPDVSEGDAKLVEYPDNLNQRDLYYFMAAPTFCYELNYPRSEKIRVRFLIRRIAEFLFLTGLILALGQQWIVPTVKNSLRPFQDLDMLRFIERIMKLAVPNHLLWLMFFYAFFHSFLNIAAELLRFGDRTFYKDWWNANTVDYFWQNWNIPIHRWAHRHLYKPMLRSGFSRTSAAVSVFFLSAFFHEFLVSVPLCMLRLWAFMGMLGQVPFSIFVSKFLTGNYGNVGVWLSLILGQPVAIMMYYHDYFVTNYLAKS